MPATFPGDYTFQWLRVDADGMSNETPIGADAVTYTPVAADAGKKVKVQVSFTDDGGTSEALTSDAYPSSGTIIDNNTAAVGNPSITGAAQVGMTLTAGPGDIADADGLTTPGYAYQWRRAGADGMDIPGAMGSTYTLTAADAGKEIKVWADFTDDGGYAERRISNETLPVAPAAATCPTGAATVWCDTLTVGHGLNSDGDPFEVGYAARTGFTAYGSLGDATFRYLGVDYTVTLLNSAGPQDLYLATTPNLPADGAGLTVHVQTYGGELDAPLAEGVFQSSNDYWIFAGKINTAPTTPLSDVR